MSKLSEWIEFVKSFDVSTVEATVKVTAFATSFAAAILIIPRVISLATQLVAAIRAIGVASAITQALSGPKGWATLAAGLAIAAGAVYGVDQLFNGLNETQAKTVAGAEKVAKGQETVAKRTIEAAEATKKVKSETDRWTESAAKLRTDLELPSETYARQIETLRESVRKGGLEWEYYERGVRKAVDALEASKASTDAKPQRVKALDATSAEFKIQTAEFRLGITPGQIDAAKLAAREKQIRDELDKFKQSIAGAADSTTPLQQSLDGVAEKAAKANVDPLLAGLDEAAKRSGKVREALTLNGLSQSATDPAKAAATIAGATPKAASQAVQSPTGESAQIVAAIAKQGELLTELAREQSQAQFLSNAEVTRLLGDQSQLLSSILSELRAPTPETTVDL